MKKIEPTITKRQLAARLFWFKVRFEELSARMERLARKAGGVKKLSVWHSFARAHTNHFRARLAAMGGPLPTMRVIEPKFQAREPREEMLYIAIHIGWLAELLEQTSSEARLLGDTSSEWVCTLTKAECEDVALDLIKAAHEKEEAA